MGLALPRHQAATAALCGLVTVDIRSTADLVGALDAVAAEMAALDYPEQDTFGVRLALEEALINSIKHGHGYDPTKVARLQYRVVSEEVVAEVADEGTGFDRRQVPDPRLPVNRERPSGRGLLLMGHYLTSVQYNERGNCVLLRKSRSLPETAPARVGRC